MKMTEAEVDVEENYLLLLSVCVEGRKMEDRSIVSGFAGRLRSNSSATANSPFFPPHILICLSSAFVAVCCILRWRYCQPLLGHKKTQRIITPQLQRLLVNYLRRHHPY